MAASCCCSCGGSPTTAGRYIATAPHFIGSQHRLHRHGRAIHQSSGNAGESSLSYQLKSAFWSNLSGKDATLGHLSHAAFEPADVIVSIGRNRSRVSVRAEISTVVKRPRGNSKKPTMIVDPITVQKGKYGYEIESCINSLSMLPPRGSVTRCMDSYKSKLTMQDFAVIFREFAQRGDWHRALRLLKYMQRQQWCKPTEHIYTIMIGIMGREGLLDKCTEIFEDMPNNDVKWNVYAFTALINAYGRNGQHEASLHLLARMKKEEVEPNLITYNTVLNACAKGGLDWEGLLNLFAQMRHEGIQPDIITYNTLLSACSTRGLVEQAGMVFKTMNESGVVPDAVSYKSLVATYDGAGKLSGVEELLKEMENEGNMPDVMGYNTLIEAYSAAGNVQGVSAVFKQMQKGGCAPNVATYSTLLEAYGRQGSFQEVRSLFLDMKDLATPPTVTTYNTLIDVFGQGGYFKEAIDLFHDMVASGVQPDDATYTGLLGVCGKGGLTKEAAEIHKHMLSNNAKPSLEASAGLISSYGKIAMYQEALISYYRIKEAGCQPHGLVYDALIEGYAKGGLYVEAGSTFYGMYKAGFLASVSTFNSLMEAYSKAGLYDDAIRFFQDMHKARCEPDEKTHLALLSTYCAMGSFDEAKAQFLEMKETTAVPEVSAYCLLLSICARRNKWEYASELLEEMQTDGMPSLHVVVADLLHGKYEDDNWQTVEHAFDILKLEDLGHSMTFYNALLEALVCFNQKARASKVFQDARQRGAFPEAIKRTKTVWSVDIHRMSAGAAVTALSTWLNQMQLSVSSGEKLPYVTAIVITLGEIEEGRRVEDLPICKVVLSYLESLNAPFEFASWNEGRLVSKGDALKPWLLDLVASSRLSLTNAPLQLNKSPSNGSIKIKTEDMAPASSARPVYVP